MENNRRNRLDLMKPVEVAIYNAMLELEKIGADPDLTKASIHLMDAKNLISDWLDKKEASAQDSQPENPPPPKP